MDWLKRLHRIDATEVLWWFGTFLGLMACVAVIYCVASHLPRIVRGRRRPEPVQPVAHRLEQNEVNVELRRQNDHFKNYIMRLEKEAEERERRCKCQIREARAAAYDDCRWIAEEMGSLEIAKEIQYRRRQA
jgi:hypothetical protein